MRLRRAERSAGSREYTSVVIAVAATPGHTVFTLMP